ncbi:MAG TPA: sulfite exporter TauE/SafE family protein [Kofleriaceae bacterium]
MLPAILLASFAGSIHCVAMCGPLVGLHGGARTIRLALVHALGRLTTYALLGALAGMVGRAIDLAGDLGAVQRTASLVAGAIVVGWGGYQLAVALGWRRGARAPATGAFTAGLVRIRTRRAVTRTWLVGVLTGLLPCGWLWAFVVAAAGTGSALHGVLVMAVFWLGTVPAMTGVLAFGGPVVDWLRRRLPAVTAVALIVLGLGTLAIRWGDAGRAQIERPSCHEVGQ